MSASPGFLSALEQGMEIEQYYNNIRNFVSENRNASPQELADAAAQWGISGEDIINATGNQPISSYSPDSNPNDWNVAEALELIPRTIDTGVQYTAAVDHGDGGQEASWGIVNPRTGEVESASRAADFIPGAPPNQFIVSSGKGVFEENDKRYQPVDLVTLNNDGTTSTSGTFNLEKNELSDFAKVVGGVTKAAAIALSGYAIGSSLGIFDGALLDGAALSGESLGAATELGAEVAAQTGAISGETAISLAESIPASTGFNAGNFTLAPELGSSLGTTGSTAGASLGGSVGGSIGGGALGTGLSTAGLGTLETVAGLEGLIGAGEALTAAGTGLSTAGLGTLESVAGLDGLVGAGESLPGVGFNAGNTTIATNLTGGGSAFVNTPAYYGLSPLEVQTIGEGALGTGLNTAVAGSGLTSLTSLEGLLAAGETIAGTGTGLNLANVTGLAPGLTAMGGAQGLTSPIIDAAGNVVTGAGSGVVGATGVTLANSVPVLGDPSSFINNPSVLGNPVTGMTPGGTPIPGTVAATPYTPGIPSTPGTPTIPGSNATPSSVGAGGAGTSIGAKQYSDVAAPISYGPVSFNRISPIGGR